MTRLVILFHSAVLLSVLPALPAIPITKCTAEQKANISSCIARNRRTYLHMKIDGYEGEELYQKVWVFTCYENVKCFENLKHCERGGGLADRKTCENLEITMEPEFKQCLEKMHQVEDDLCVGEFMLAFASNSSDQKFKCDTYKKFCARDFISEKCAPGVVNKFETLVNHLKSVKKCEQFD